MKCWLLSELGGTFTLTDRPLPTPRAGSVVVEMQASVLMSYMQDYVAGKLPIYHTPDGPFIPGGNGVGIIHAVGPDVWHLKVGQRVAVSSHLVSQENVSNPAEMLIGVTAGDAISQAMQASWPDGTLAEYALLPAAAVTPADDLPMDDAALAMTMRCIVPYGGLLRGRLAAGETIVVSGSTGAYGTACVMVALAMGASRVVVVGRSQHALSKLVALEPSRVFSVLATGKIATDVKEIQKAARGNADMALDMVGNAQDPNMTLSALRSLRKGGRLVLMGSMTVPLPISYLEVMLNGWEILGQFMYPRNAYRQLFDLIRAGLLDMTALRACTYSLSNLTEAIEAATHADSFECIVIDHKNIG